MKFGVGREMGWGFSGFGFAPSNSMKGNVYAGAYKEIETIIH